MRASTGPLRYEPAYQALLKNTQAVRELEEKLAVRLGMSGHSDIAIMVLLLDYGEHPVNWLGLRVGLTSGSMTAALDRLEGPGWIERRQSDDDRRSTLVKLTKTGQQAAQIARKDREIILSKVFAGFSEVEINTLNQLLKRAGARARGLKDSIF